MVGGGANRWAVSLRFRLWLSEILRGPGESYSDVILKGSKPSPRRGGLYGAGMAPAALRRLRAGWR